MKCYLNLTALMLGLVFSQAFNIASIAAPSQAITSQQHENIEVAKDYQKQGQYQYAIECFNQLLKNPLEDKAELYYRLADNYYLQGQYIMAKRMLREYDNQNDKSVYRKALVDSLKGLASADLGEYFLALQHYNNAVGNLYLSLK
jgi:tetratricopeptide (TPR) repeat protein